MREDGKKKPSPKVVKMFKRSWVFPAIYVITAAVLLSGVFAYQFFMKDTATNSDKKTPTVQMEDNNKTVPVVTPAPAETVNVPFASMEDVEIARPFYDVSGTPEEQEAALVYYNNTYTENTGITYKSKDGNPFEVKASLSGTVVSVDEDNLLGVVVTIAHSEDIETSYQGLSKTLVEEGMAVEQGQAIGSAGTSELTKEDGVGVHFEVRKAGMPINPSLVLNESFSSIDEIAKKMNSSENVSGTPQEGEKSEQKDEETTTEPTEDTNSNKNTDQSTTEPVDENKTENE